MKIFGNRRGSGCGLGTQNIDFPAGKCTFLTAPVVGDKSVQMHWKRKILVFLQEYVHFLETEEGLLVASGRKIFVFDIEKAILIALVGTTEGALMHWKQKY